MWDILLPCFVQKLITHVDNRNVITAGCITETNARIKPWATLKCKSSAGYELFALFTDKKFRHFVAFRRAYCLIQFLKRNYLIDVRRIKLLFLLENGLSSEDLSCSFPPRSLWRYVWAMLPAHAFWQPASYAVQNYSTKDNTIAVPIKQPSYCEVAKLNYTHFNFATERRSVFA